MATGINTADFTTFVLGDLGQSVTLEAVTKTISNITGDRTLAYATGSSITVIFLRKNTIREYDKEGVLEKADAYLMAKTTDGVVRNDRITHASNKYRVGTVIRRDPDGSTPMFDMCALHLIS
jgi:hypothetical protein|tara:strand:- start:1252 stop:1617 length:366 start_codon:yes stop_codon:yes gene_type:complete